MEELTISTFRNLLLVVSTFQRSAILLNCFVFWFMGQEEVEQGFSQNKSSMRTNMLENTVVAKRQIRSHLKCNELTANKILISKDMLQSVRAVSTNVFLELKKKRFQFEQEWMLKKQRLSDLHKKYSMTACSIAHDTANSKKVQELLCKAGAMKEKTNKLLPETKEI